MEIKQQLRLSQSLVMTPQLQQAIRLLAVSEPDNTHWQARLVDMLAYAGTALEMTGHHPEALAAITEARRKATDFRAGGFLGKAIGGL